MKILIVEDDKKIAEAVKKGLKQESFTVDVANNGLDGNDFALSEKYDVIIMDIMLPDIDGLTICKNVREVNIDTPILLLTARDQIDDIVAGLNCGADDYLTKPFDFEELLARVQALSRRPRNLIGNFLELADLKLDLLNKQLLINGKQVELTKKEYLLLEFLMKNSERIVTKEDIIQHVWSFEAEVLPNIVEVYIRYLRNKIDKPLSKNYIKTVRGFGYKLSEL